MINSTSSSAHHDELFLDRQGLRLAAYLSLSQADVTHDISERLRVARNLALAVRKPARTAAAVALGGDAASLTWQGDDPMSWWDRIGSVIPLLALVGGLLFINAFQNDDRARELAEVDVALLTDDLPVAAFADPGFLQYLKTER